MAIPLNWPIFSNNKWQIKIIFAPINGQPGLTVKYGWTTAGHLSGKHCKIKLTDMYQHFEGVAGQIYWLLRSQLHSAGYVCIAPEIDFFVPLKVKISVGRCIMLEWLIRPMGKFFRSFYWLFVFFGFLQQPSHRRIKVTKKETFSRGKKVDFWPPENNKRWKVVLQNDCPATIYDF